MIRGKEILVVEDDPIFRNMIVAYLQQNGALVSQAENGLDGLRALRHSIPDLLLCDLSMPVMTGMEFVEEISVQYPMVPVIVISATDKMSDVAAALRLGVKDFLVKPIKDIQMLGRAAAAVIEATEDSLGQKHDFSQHWFDTEGRKDLQALDAELGEHLHDLENDPRAARELLVGLMPINRSAQGDWELSYRVLQSADELPVILDYTWLMDGRLAFYLIDTQSAKESGTATTLLIRAFFNDYLRTRMAQQYDINTLVCLLETSIMESGYAAPIKGLFGVFDACDRSIQLIPTGLGVNLITSEGTRSLTATRWLGQEARRNQVLSSYVPPSGARVALAELNSAAFSVNIRRRNERYITK
uniref:response regulator n=1 Tax=Thaumasiovibrio occultus TaxID=1891184 RepID=UPI000B363098|nr:response regulator [Thaumasiovibrio occultus]